MNPTFRLIDNELHLRYEDESGDDHVIKYPGQSFYVDLSKKVFVVDGENRFPPSTVYTFSDEKAALWLYRDNDAVTTVTASDDLLHVHTHNERLDLFVVISVSEEAHNACRLRRNATFQADQALAWMHVRYGYPIPDGLTHAVIEEEIKVKGDIALKEGDVWL